MNRPPSVPEKLVSASLVFLLAGLVATAAHAEESEWARFRGPGVDGVSSERQVFDDFGQLGLEVTWKTRIGSGYSGIAVAGGKAVTLHAEGESDVMTALDAATGRKLWTYAFADTYAGHDGSHDGPIATPLIAGGRVFGLGPRGQLFAVDAATGKEIWKTDLVKDHEIKKPHYGFGTSPILEGGVLVLELGGEGSAVAGFDPATGKKKWSTGNDAVGYQVPVPMTLGGRRQLVAAGETKLFGLDAGSGELLWEWAHEGTGGTGAHSMTPVPAGDGKIFLAHQADASKLVALAGGEGDAAFETVWEGRAIRNSYNVPIYHDGHVYAFSSRFLICADAATGETRWRSRWPGDGFLIVVDGRLVIATKQGGVHVVEATPEAYREVAALPVFEDFAWTPPSFAGGSIYARSFGEIARLDLTAGVLDSGIEVASHGVSPSSFGQFLAAVDAAADEKKAAVVDRFMAAQKSFPIVEGDRLVHFVYRGGAADVAVAGDPFGARQERSMTRVRGTDLFYHSIELEPDARASYLFIEDYEEIRDPLNARQTTTTVVGRDMEFSQSGDELPMSWLAMPGWRPPAHLAEAPEASRGRIESHELESEVLAGDAPPPGSDPPEGDPPEGDPPPPPKIGLHVYLPHGYDEGVERFPVAYVHGGESARERGRLPNSLDNLIGDRVAPLIVAFVDIPAEGPKYDQALVGEVVPFVDETYRTVAAPEARANVGAYFSGLPALISTLRHPELFSKVATQSLLLLTMFENMIYPLIEGIGEQPPAIYMDWGTYDLRNPHENWDIPAANRKLSRALADSGAHVAGGEAHDGSGWSSWRNRTDQVFETLFPMR